MTSQSTSAPVMLFYLYGSSNQLFQAQLVAQNTSLQTTMPFFYAIPSEWITRSPSIFLSFKTINEMLLPFKESIISRTFDPSQRESVAVDAHKMMLSVDSGISDTPVYAGVVNPFLPFSNGTNSICNLATIKSDPRFKHSPSIEYTLELERPNRIPYSTTYEEFIAAGNTSVWPPSVYATAALSSNYQGYQSAYPRVVKQFSMRKKTNMTVKKCQPLTFSATPYTDLSHDQIGIVFSGGLFVGWGLTIDSMQLNLLAEPNDTNSQTNHMTSIIQSVTYNPPTWMAAYGGGSHRVLLYGNSSAVIAEGTNNSWAGPFQKDPLEIGYEVLAMDVFTLLSSAGPTVVVTQPVALGTNVSQYISNKSSETTADFDPRGTSAVCLEHKVACAEGLYNGTIFLFAGRPNEEQDTNQTTEFISAFVPNAVTIETQEDFSGGFGPAIVAAVPRSAGNTIVATVVTEGKVISS